MSTIHETSTLGADAQRDKSAVLIRLLKGPLYLHRQRDLWQVLLREQHSIRDYFQQIGLSLLIDDCIAAVKAGGTLVIFPEGTRTVPGQPLRLQRGAANIAVRGGLDITPVRITCTPLTLTKGQKWYRVPSRRFHVQLEVGEDLPIAPFLNETGDAPRGDALAARRVTDHLAHYFDFAGEPSRAGT